MADENDDAGEGDAAMSAQPVEYPAPEPTAADDIAELLEIVASAPDGDGFRYEIIHGELVVTPLATEDHQSVAQRMLLAILPVLPSVWNVYWDAGIIAAGECLVPDLIVLDQRIVQSGEQYRIRPVRLAVEVESASTKYKDRRVKAESYARQGIDAYWRVEKSGKTHVYTEPQTDGTWDSIVTVAPGDTLKLAVPFAAQLAQSDWL